MRLLRRSYVLIPRYLCSWRSLITLVTILYGAAFLYSVTNSHYRVLYLSAQEVYHGAQNVRRVAHPAIKTMKDMDFYDLADGHSRKLLQQGRNNDAAVAQFYKNLKRSDQPRSASTDKRLPLCSPPLDELEYVRVNPFVEVNMTDVVRENPTVKRGQWKPQKCRSVQKVAIIIPHRNRHHHLTLLLRRLHPLLQLQQIEYQVFVIEQLSPEEFNRGMLLNVGFLEALVQDPSFDCFVFQDVDLIPEHFQNLYMCTEHIHHLASAIDEMRFHVMFYNYAGGVVAVNKRSFVDFNGYANTYWGWGNEDDDFSARTLESGMLLTRPLERIGRYKMVRHKKAARSDSGNALFMNWRDRWQTDGIRSLAEQRPYTVESVDYTDLYVNISVSLDRERTARFQPQSASEQQKDQYGVWNSLKNMLFFLRFYFP